MSLHLRIAEMGSEQDDRITSEQHPDHGFVKVGEPAMLMVSSVHLPLRIHELTPLPDPGHLERPYSLRFMQRLRPEDQRYPV